MTLRRVVFVAFAAPVMVFGGALAVVLSPAGEIPSQEPADAVIALAGESERLHVADEIADLSGGKLVVSWVPASSSTRDERCQGEGERVLCFSPLPVSTAGEARAIGGLSEERAWQRILVVTSRHHVGRVRMLVHQCVDEAEVTVVSATEQSTASDVLKEALGVLVGATTQRAC